MHLGWYTDWQGSVESFLTQKNNLRDRSTGVVSPDLPPHDGRDFGPQKFDGLHHLGVRHGPDGQLDQKTLVPEYLVLVENFFNDLLGTPHEGRPPERGFRKGGGRPAPQLSRHRLL
jgi:hypothetical protein